MPKDMSESIVDAIVDDLTDRRGLRQEWEQIDDGIQYEIKKKWRGIVRREIKKDKPVHV